MPTPPLTSKQWFARPPIKPGGPLKFIRWIRLIIGLAVAGIFYWVGWTILATVAASLTLLFALISIISSQSEARVEAGFQRFGHWVGQGLTWVILVPLYFTGFVAVRIYDALGRRDPLSLRLQTDKPSYWLEADTDARKLRWFGSSFVTEPQRHAVRRRRQIIALAIVTFIGGELILRGLGYGDPVLYIDNTQIGYLPASNQSVKRQGNRIEINAYGMRSPSFLMPKPTGTFRILILGDSTLYGGSYIDQAELYARRLQAQLGEMGATQSVEVLAMGVNGWGPFHEIGYVDVHGTFDADLAIVALPYGDVRRPLSRLAATPYLPAKNPPNLAYEEVIYHLVWRWRGTRLGKPNTEERAARFELGYGAYKALAHRLATHVPEVMFEVLPSFTAGTTQTAPTAEQGVVERLRSTLRPIKLGFPVGVFADAPSGLMLYHDSVHLHRDGHRLYANYLAERITKDSIEWNTFTKRGRP